MKLSRRQVRQIVRRYARGESATAIAMDYGVSEPTVTYHARRAGVWVRRRQPPYDVADERLILAEMERLAATLKRSPSQVASHIHVMSNRGVFPHRPAADTAGEQE